MSQPERATDEAATRVREEKISGYYSLHLRRTVEATVFLPPGYPDGGPYPLLLSNDGQDMPAVGTQGVLEGLLTARHVAPLVLVAIHCNHDRMHEYGTARVKDYAGRGSKATRYTRFVLEEWLPHIRTRYAVTDDPAQVAFMGFSLGGLSAFDIVWHHPEHFGQVGVFSGSFWWRRKSYEDNYRDTDRIAHRLVREGTYQPGLRFWFEAGTLDEESDRDGDGLIDAIGDTVHLLEELAQKGYRRDTDLHYHQEEGGRHDPATWGRTLPHFLRWAFPALDQRPVPEHLSTNGRATPKRP